MKSIFINTTGWINTNKVILCIVFISFAFLRFLHLNYLNWDHGHLCTGYGGVQYGGDYFRYLNGAKNLVEGNTIFHSHYLYLGYILFLAFFIKLNLSLEFVLIAQLIIALFASYTIYDLCKTITGSKLAGTFCAGILLMNPLIVQWHLFIHTESLYSSMLIISTWLLTKSYFKKSIKYYIPAILITIFTMMIRQNGWMIIPAVITFIIFCTKIKIISKAIIIVGALIMIPCSYIFLKDSIEYFRIAESYKTGIVVCGVPEAGRDSFFENAEKKNDSNTLSYSVEKIYHSVILGAKRISAVLFPIYRPYITTKFILRFLFWTLPFYLFTIIGIFYFFRNKCFAYCALLLFYHLIFIGFTYADWDFRFLAYFLPIFILLGCCGLHFFYKSLNKHFRKNEPV